MKKFLYTLIFLMPFILKAQNTVVDIIANSPDHKILESALIAADLASELVLSGAGPFTVFAPTDAAFEALPAGTLDALFADPSGDLTDILLFHALRANVGSGNLYDGQAAKTLNRKYITVKIENGDVFINNAQVTVTDLVADNGVVHVIDAVLLQTNSIMDIIGTTFEHTSLEGAVLEADLAGTLSGSGPFTIFAPTDEAVNALPDETIDALLSDPSGVLTDMLLYHILDDDVRSSDLSDGQSATTINGQDFAVKVEDGTIFINNAQVTVADLVADNGVVHIINAVLLPPATNSIVDFIVNSPHHTILETAVIEANLAGTLSGPGPFTIFAPTDTAFDALPAGVVDALLADPTADLTSILLYHVLSGDIRSTDLTDGQTVTTFNGRDIMVSLTGGVFINEAQVTIADLVSSNGVVHIIDKVLLPTTSSTDDQNTFASFNVFPNPTCGNLTITMSGLDFNTTSTINIIDASGALVQNFRNVENDNIINVGILNDGLYIMEYINENKRYYKKIMVNK